ncbi:MAG TPA: hypothetical protein HPP76_01690 [Desulfuromonadales bacterium]|nr:hypothetical protein [Desulfuromonadales bacterium]
MTSRAIPKFDKNNDLRRISSALHRLAIAASGNLGSDCYIHAAIAQEMLNRLGVSSKLVAGYAAWRVGNDDGDVILHAPLPNMPSQPGSVAYHMWLEVNNHLIDFTTYQLRHKALQMDKLDGGTTTVTWCPDYLAVPKKSVSSLRAVIQLRAGMYFYKQDTAIENIILSAARPLDDDDVNTAWLLYQNQELCVFGPNNMYHDAG